MITYNPDSSTFFSTLINGDQFASGFGTKALGDARNLQTIQIFFHDQGIPVKKIIELEQIHSTNIEVVTELKAETEKLDNADGVITHLRNSALIVRNADCVPIVYADKSTGYIGISHNGWRGSLKKLAPKMIQKFLSLGSNIKNIYCSLGPAIGMCCYDVDEDVYYSFMEELEKYAKQIFHFKKGRWHANLTLLNYLLLREAGIKKENIDFFPFCTKCDNQRFFSRRRVNHDNFERMFNFIIRK